tara:strand:- start:140 stop:460 length:321 start_codon:yes stop_codon:yes gene_type:complete
VKKQKTYAFVCLVSLLLFFTSPVIFISGVVFDSLIELNVEAVDLMDGETESENETPAPLEEEQHATTFEIDRVLDGEAKKAANDLYLHSNWKSVPCTTITPPPDFI